MNKNSRVLQTGSNQITVEYSSSHKAVDLVKEYNELDYITAHSLGTVMMTQIGQENNPGSSGNASYGNFVKIKHPNGQSTLYAHMESVLVQTGDTVATGQTIGYMGNTGNSYGAHLHFELRDENENRLNPIAYINADLENLPTETEEDDMTEAEVRKIAEEVAKTAIDNYIIAQAKKPESEWSVQEGAFQRLTEKEIMNGRAPRSSITREEAAAVVERALNDAFSNNGTEKK